MSFKFIPLKKKKLYHYPEERLIENQPKRQESKYVLDTIDDSEGLRNAYDHGDYFIHGQTMFIAGSHTAKDWWDDVTKIPVWGSVTNATRYQAAEKAKLVNVSDEATTYEEVVETLLESNETTPVTELDTSPLVSITETVEKPKRVRTKSVKPVEPPVTPLTDDTPPPDEPVEKPKRVRTKPAKPTVEVSEPPPEPTPKPSPESSPEPPPTPTPKAKSKAKAKAQPVELSGKVIRVLTEEEVEAKKKARPKREPKPKVVMVTEAPKVRQSRALMRAQLYEKLLFDALP